MEEMLHSQPAIAVLEWLSFNIHLLAAPCKAIQWLDGAGQPLERGCHHYFVRGRYLQVSLDMQAGASATRNAIGATATSTADELHGHGQD